MDMNMLDMYNATEKKQPDVVWIDEIIAMEGWKDKMLGKVPEEEVKTAEACVDKDIENWDTNMPADDKKLPEDNNPNKEEDKSLDNWNEKDNMSSDTESSTWNDVETDDTPDVDLDEVIKRIETDWIDTDLIRELEWQQLRVKELEVKYEVALNELSKNREKLAALETWDTAEWVPSKLKWIVNMYSSYESNWDEWTKWDLVEKISWLLTNLTGKDVYNFVNWEDKSKNLTDLDSNTGSTSAPEWSSASSDNWSLDPNLIKEMWLSSL